MDEKNKFINTSLAVSLKLTDKMGSQSESISMEKSPTTSGAHNTSNYDEEKSYEREKLTFTVTENPPVHITIFYAIQVGQVKHFGKNDYFTRSHRLIMSYLLE